VPEGKKEKVMGSSDDTALNLVGKVYDAALDEQNWPSFLDAFARAVGGCSSILRSVDLQTHKAGFVASVGYDPAWQAAYCDHFVKVDYLTPALAQFQLGEAKPGEYVFSQSEQRKTEYFNDYLAPQNKTHVMGSLLIKDGSHTLMFAAQRGKRAGAFGEEDIRLMNILAPHVTRAVQVHRKLSSITVEKEWALGALDQLRMGVILTDSLGVPLFVNRAAEQMMAQHEGISLCHGRLALNNPSDTALLLKLIANAAQGAAIGGDMRIAQPGRVEALQCLVSPVSPEFSARLNIYLGSGCAAIFLSKPGSLQLSPQRLAILYGLSPAESRLVAKLAAFDSLDQAASNLGIASGTARAQLGAVFAKTGAKGQAELLMLLATGTLGHCLDEISYGDGS
jgi:DNA-binding CsgD family transcriptional regulator/PAS domain-containing protein